MKLKVAIFSLLTVFLFYFSIFLAGILPFIASMKTNLTGDSVLEFSLNILLHPINNIQTMIDNKNPLLFVCFGASIVLIVYLMYKSRRRDYENVSDRYGVQGTARWATKAEIFNVEDEIIVHPENKMLDTINDTLKGDYK
ncbi:hypothetical protein [Paraliobacillus ryukyuensis]|uniref:hypothetical protein n=1 Tax=Paraliobacillus ryukyuensis TaxID=200904 RepID=UPI0009A717C9|nr:hypothetical protein [Paraliobacillus ryukyuensis]